MQKLTLVVAALFLASTTASAELVQSQPLATHANDSSTLAGELLARDSATPPASPLFQNSSLSSKTTRPAHKADNLASTVSVVVQDNSSDVSSVSAADSDAEPSLLDQINTLAASTVRKFSQTGAASWYGRQFNGRKTASGERFDMHAMTAAHRSLPLSCYIRVTNRDNGKSVVVKVNDRGPFHGKRILDLSYAAAQQLGITQRGTGNVTIERIDSPTTD